MSTDASRWQRLQTLFAEALALPVAEREAFVTAAAAEDAALADELRRLLAHDPGAGPEEANDAADRPVYEAIAVAARQALGVARQGLVGRRFGAWRVVSHIADGGMGAVYRAERADGQYQQVAALKLLNPARVSPAAAARLAQERQILARLAHPHIARLLDGGVGADGVPYLVMEFVDGRPIDAWCHAQGLDTAARLRLFVQVCGAVDHAHRHFVVHRDLKPSNILVDTEGRPRLLDFGIARLLEAGEGGGEALTRSGERLLTPSHASPEQVRGGDITTASDVYALGVLLYELLTGRLPHEEAATNPAELARAIVESEPPRPSRAVTAAAAGSGGSRRLAALHAAGERLTPERLARELAGDLDNIVLMALRKEPGRRYASAAELARDVERHLAHRPVRARPDTPGYRLHKLWQRHPVAVSATALALLLATAGGALFTWRLAEERDRALLAERRAVRTAEFTASLLSGTGAAKGGARQVSVLDLLKSAAARIEAELKDEPEVSARLRVAIGGAFSSWDANDEAMAMLKGALPVLRTLQPVPHETIALTLTDIFVTAHSQGRYEEALDWARQAEAAFAQAGDPALHAMSIAYVGVVLNDMRRPAQAIAKLGEALTAFDKAVPEGSIDSAYTLNAMAQALHEAGRLDEAAAHYERALALQRRLGSNALDQGLTTLNLGMLNYDLGRLDEAERFWAQGRALFEGVYGPMGNESSIVARSVQGRAASDRGRHDEAVAHTQAALRAAIRHMGAGHIRVAEMQRNHADALLEAGRGAEARRLYEQAMATSTRLLSPGHPDLARLWLGLGRVAQAQGRLEDAERHWRRGLAITEALPEGRRSVHDLLDWELASLLARRGQRADAIVRAAAATERLRQRVPADHPRLLMQQAALALPPFEARPSVAAAAAAGQSLEALRRRLGPAAPLALELEQALAAAG